MFGIKRKKKVFEKLLKFPTWCLEGRSGGDGGDSNQCSRRDLGEESVNSLLCTKPYI